MVHQNKSRRSALERSVAEGEKFREKIYLGNVWEMFFLFIYLFFFFKYSYTNLND